jgi:hypothetical protein
MLNLQGLGIGRSFRGFLALRLNGFFVNWFWVPCVAEFVLGLLVLPRAFATFDVLLIGFEDDVVVEGILIEIFLLTFGQVSTDVVLRVDGFMMPINGNV